MSKPVVPEGYTVRFQHVRWEGSTGSQPDPRGGYTIARVLNDVGVVARGEARCSRHDNYSKAIGRNIALGRALKALGSYRP